MMDFHSSMLDARHWSAWYLNPVIMSWGKGKINVFKFVFRRLKNGFTSLVLSSKRTTAPSFDISVDCSTTPMKSKQGQSIRLINFYVFSMGELTMNRSLFLSLHVIKRRETILHTWKLELDVIRRFSYLRKKKEIELEIMAIWMYQFALHCTLEVRPINLSWLVWLYGGIWVHEYMVSYTARLTTFMPFKR